MNILKTHTTLTGTLYYTKLPSIIYKDGTQEYLNIKTSIRFIVAYLEAPSRWNEYTFHTPLLHRHSLEGPAIIHKNGTKKYYKNGKLHRPSLEGSGSPLEIPS
ncbi:MAG: hypothetical protein JKX76_01260 [Colwellia sp.]|nr:hypothetical protein [Colwellia sp.]